MDVRITAVGESPDGLRSLGEWLVGEEELRGRVRSVESAPRPGTLGAITEALVVALAPGGAVTVLAGVLIAWIRHRVHDGVYEITRPDGISVKVSTKRVQGADAAGVRELVTELSRSLDEDSRTVPSPPAHGVDR